MTTTLEDKIELLNEAAQNGRLTDLANAQIHLNDLAKMLKNLQDSISAAGKDPSDKKLVGALVDAAFRFEFRNVDRNRVDGAITSAMISAGSITSEQINNALLSNLATK